MTAQAQHFRVHIKHIVYLPMLEVLCSSRRVWRLVRWVPGAGREECLAVCFVALVVKGDDKALQVVKRVFMPVEGAAGV